MQISLIDSFYVVIYFFCQFACFIFAVIVINTSASDCVV